LANEQHAASASQSFVQQKKWRQHLYILAETSSENSLFSLVQMLRRVSKVLDEEDGVTWKHHIPA